MVEVITAPVGFFRPIDTTFHIRRTTQSAGRRLSDGQHQLTGRSYGVWDVHYSLPREFDGDRVMRFEALISQLRGRQNILRLPICDPMRYGPMVSPQQQPWSDGTWFSDGTGFLDGTGTHPLLTTAAAAVGATSLFTGVTDPVRPTLRVGDKFSYDDFLYRVVSRTAAGWARFEPELRTAIPSGAQLVTDPAWIKVRLANDGQGVRSREMLRWGSALTVSFTEAFDR